MLGELSATGATILFEAPKPIFGSPPFRCSDWFNASNPVCKGGFEIAKSELEVSRRPALASMAQVMQGIPKSALWDPAPTLCPGGMCKAYRNGEPLFFDGDHLSGVGNAMLLEDFEAHVTALFRSSAAAAR